jgi:alanyl-tRNA synthetase
MVNFMKSNELRKSFLDFFKSKGHTIVPSASLVPDNDPTLLFTNAGMNQFKDIFLGKGKRNFVRAVDTQKCMRVSGKHNDLEDVGKDTYHHTFFEMLGNWSFGDYYKKEAILWAWELLTTVWKLPKEKLYATVHNSDDEALVLWKETTDIDEKHILKFGDKENFWEMGAAGPCGPCSEIHIDRGEDACDKKWVRGHHCSVNGGCARYIELWNLVFIQYNRKEDGSLEPLPSRHVDTGMGFERIVSVVQGKKSNYDTNLFSPIISKIEELCGKKYQEETGMPMRVIADHIRALSFATADGVMPSNEGKGYVIRKILRRAIRYGKRLGFDSPFLHSIVDVLSETMGEVFPEIRERKEMIKGLILSEEESFFKTLNRGLEKLDDIVKIAAQSKNKTIDGESIFMLYDSLGLPIDFIENVAEDEGLKLDKKRFDELMEGQKERARANWKGEAFDFSVVSGKAVPTKYVGEEMPESKASIQWIVKNNSLVETAVENDDVVLIFDQTPFYAEKGGQIGDIGVVEKDEMRIAVANTKIFEDAVLHYGRIINGSFKKGDTVFLRVNQERKNAIARNHTATHLIHKALKNTVGSHAAQSGSLVGPERLRFDFTHSKALSKEEIEKIENEVNQIVLQNLPVQINCMSKEEAVQTGAVAIFEEKYGQVVRVVEVAGYSKELCGGTHVKRSGDIGLVKIVQETSISAGTRRIEALTGLNSLENYRDYFYKMKEISTLFNCAEEKILAKIALLQDNLRQKDKEIEEFKREAAKSGIEELFKKSIKVGEHEVIIERVNFEADAMLQAIDAFKAKVKSGYIFLISSPSEDKVAIAAGSTKSLMNIVKAGDIARETAKIVGGGGGGRPELAQAGGKDPSKIPEALEKAKEWLEVLKK